MSEAGTKARADELKRALLAIRDLRRRVGELETRSREPIAIVGTACRLPGGCTTPDAFWDLLRQGIDATCDVPSDRWDAAALYDPDPNAVGRAYVRRGGFLQEPIDRFDPAFFGISAREAAAMDPIHRMLLEMSWEALERAGIPPHTLENTSAGVFAGLSASDYELLQRGNGLDAIHSYRGTGTASSVAGGRISHFFGLHGPNLAVDTACSSGLVAIVLAVEQLRSHRCDLALAGSMHLMLAPDALVFLCRMRALAADGRCRTFDAAASGYARGEGGGVLVLKRLVDAQADGDPVLAVIRGAAMNHDGRSSGLTVPNPIAQRLVIEAALRDADVKPVDVSYVEAHGTATQLGDPIELRAMTDVLCRERPANRPLFVGSVKTNIGHLEPAAGIAGILKLVGALTHGMIPPHLHLETPTPHFAWDRAPLRVPTTLTPWSVEGPRVAGVSAFGFSGTNAHVILEEAPALSPTNKPLRPEHVITLSARTRDAVRVLAGRYAERFFAGETSIADLAFSSTTGRDHHAFRAAVHGASAADVEQSLRALARGDHAIEQVRASESRPLAFLFSGQGTQTPGMGRELFATAPVFRAALERCAAVLEPHLDRPLLPLLLDAGEAEAIDQTAYTQPALFAFEYALTELWRSFGVEPAFVLGHSLGEYVAATVAGVMPLEDALPLVALRGRLMQRLPGGGRMVAVRGPAELVASAVDGLDDVSIAAFNGPANVVVSGSAAGVEAVLARLEPHDLHVTDLKVSHAFHSPLMAPMLAEYGAALRRVHWSEPRLGLVSNVTGALMTAAEAADVERWERHVLEPVRFSAGIAELARRGARTFVEIGPHATLVALGQELGNDASLRFVPSLRRGRPAWEQLGEAVAALYSTGHEVDWSQWNREYAGRRVPGPTYPFEREQYWYTDLVDGVAQSRAAARPARASDEHPLLGSPFSSPAFAGSVFERRLQASDPAYLSDHRVQRRVVVPGAALVEMLHAAARASSAPAVARLTAVSFERPLVLGDDEQKTCQVIVAPQGNGSSSVQVVVADSNAGGNTWHTHARATLEPGASPRRSDDSLSVCRARAPRAVSVDELYRGIAARGIKYGDSFRALVECSTGADTAFGRAELEARDAAHAARYGMHPCLLDAGWQLLAAIEVSPNDGRATFLPSGIDEVELMQPLGDSCFIYAAVRAQPDPDLLLADLTFFAADGRRCAQLIGCRARRMTRALARDQARDDESVYEIAWSSVEIAASTPVVGGSWLLLDDGAAMASGLAAWLERSGARCIRACRGDAWRQDGDRWIVPDDSTGDERLAAAIAAAGGIRGLLDLWSTLPSCTEDADASRLVERVSAAGLATARTCAAAADDLRFVAVLTRGGVGPEGAGPGAWDKAAAQWGLLRVLQAEYAHIDCRALDIDLGDAPLASERLAALLFGAHGEDRLAVRRDGVFAPRLVPQAGPSVSACALPASENYRVALPSRGTLEALQYATAPREAPGPDDVEVRVRVTALNFRDVLNVLGMYPGKPGLPGVELVGTVCRAGENVRHLKVGDVVFGLGTGAFAAYVTVFAPGLARVPPTLSAEEAATVPLAFLTAEWGLARVASLRRGERVLIHAGAGGVGQAAVQIARAAGAEIYATAGSEEKRAYLRSQGVRHVFDSRSASFAAAVLDATGGEGVDVVLNSLTGDMLKRSLELLRAGGRFVELGKAELLDARDVADRYPGVRYESFDLGGVLHTSPDEFRTMFERMAERFAAGELRPLRVRTYPAEQLGDAFRYMAQARHIGKVVVASRTTSTAGIRADAAYLVTGASGGIGRALLEWLVERGAGVVVANARSLSDGLAQRIDEWRAAGKRVEVAIGDVAIAADAMRVVAIATKAAPLAGIFHAAGTLDDGLLSSQTRERFAGVLRPKLAAWNLHRATAALDVEHFVMFGSIAGILGGPGQGNYASANAFLAALAERRRRNGLAALTVEWGPWAGSGMAARLAPRERVLIEERGIEFLDPAMAVGLLERLLTASGPRYVVAAVDWAKVNRAARAAPPLLRAVLSAAPRAAASTRSSAVEVPATEVLLRAALPERLERLTRYVQAALGAVLGMRGRPLDAATEVAQYGFDSLMAIEFRNRVETDIGIVVPVSKLLGSATAAQLAEELAAALEPVEAKVSSRVAVVEGEI